MNTTMKKGIEKLITNTKMVGVVGIEPTTPSMSPRCSPAELHAHLYNRSKFILIFLNYASVR